MRNPEFQAPIDERRLFGVASWPKVYNRSESEENNRSYGSMFAEESLTIGQRIGRQKYSSIAQVWADCRKWRANYEIVFGARDRDFGRSRIGESKVYDTPIFTSTRYAYVAARIMELPGAKREIYDVPYPHEPSMFARTESVLQVTYQATTTIGGQEKELTTLVAFAEADGTPKYTAPGVHRQIGGIRHTSTDECVPLRREADRLYKAAIEPGKSPQERLQIMGDLHWILAHAMLDRRGSAAKSEMVVRAIGYAVGIELPPFAPGIVPDLEAFLTPREEYVSRYAQLFARPPLPDPLVSGVASMSL